MKDNRKNTDNTQATTGIAKPALISRRNLLKHGAAAMPAVLTLQSGAALAASSAYIGSVSREGARYLDTNVLCLDVSNAELLPNGTTYRFVDTNYANVYIMPDGHYHSANGSDDYVLADEFCRTGGEKVLDATGNKFVDLKGWEPINLPHGNNNGILVSSTALDSITAAFGSGVEKNILP
jgi:hypothetical protein